VGNDHVYEWRHLAVRGNAMAIKDLVVAEVKAKVPACGSARMAAQLFARKNPLRGVLGTRRDSDLGCSLRTISKWETSGKPARLQDWAADSWKLSQRFCSDFMMARSIGTVTLLYVPSTPGTSCPMRDSTANRG
jgi:hypothetical protein